MNNKEEYICGSKELDKAMDRNLIFFPLHLLVLILAICIPHSRVFLPCLLACLLNFVESEWHGCEGDTNESCSKCIRKTTSRRIIVIAFFSIIAIINGCMELLKEGFSASYIPSYILFAFNVLLMFNLRSVYNIAKNISNKLEYKAKVKEDVENISSRVTNTVKISEEMFYGLDEDEKDILRPYVEKLVNLFMQSYDKMYSINDPDTFLNIEYFLNRYAKTINAYKKGKGSSDLDFLRRLNNSAEELYNTLNSKKQNLRKIEFESKLEVLKIRLSKIF